MEKLKKWGDYLSGYISGLISCTVCAPLDLTRTRMNLNKTTRSSKYGFLETLKGIYKKRGYKGFYDGFSATSVGVPLFQFLYFGLYYRMKDKIDSNNKLIRDFGSAMISGSLCQVLTNPIWVIRIRMQSAIMHMRNVGKFENKSIGFYTKQIYNKEGIKGFYRGTIASLFGVIHVCINMPTYDLILRYLTNDNNTVATKGQVLIASNVAKFFACVITYPHVVIRSRQQDFRNLAHQRKYYNTCHKEGKKVVLSLKRVFKTTWRNEGILGFYGGIVPDLIKVLPTNTVLMLSFEFFRNQFGITKH